MNWKAIKAKVGITLIIFGFISPIFALIVPLFGLSANLTTALVAFFMVGGPEIGLILGGILAGKEGIVMVKNRIMKMLGLPEGRYPATRSQYNLALFILVVWFLSLLAPFYIESVAQFIEVTINKWFYYVIFDVLAVVAILLIGGHQFVTKLVSLFTWEEWTLPPEAKN